MTHESALDARTGRKFYLDYPDDWRAGDELVFLLNLHGGGSVGSWQRLYFPAFQLANEHRLVIAAPSAATKEPMRRWVADADDDHLKNIVEQVFERFGAKAIRAFWLVGHSQGGMTSSRLLEQPFFADRVDGWLSLSGGRIGAVELPESFFSPIRSPQGTLPNPTPGRRPGMAPMPTCDISFIFATGEHEVVGIPETSPWAERYGAGPREPAPDVVDDEPGLIYDTTREGRSTPAWGLSPRPGTARLWIYPGARDERVIADVMRLDKGHTEGLEPRIAERLVGLMVGAPGGKARDLTTSPTSRAVTT
jgi:hypothetical protein